jgi:hypothetical protein
MIQGRAYWKLFFPAFILSRLKLCTFLHPGVYRPVQNPYFSPPLEDNIFPSLAICQKILLTHPLWLYFFPFCIYFYLFNFNLPFIFFPFSFIFSSVFSSPFSYLFSQTTCAVIPLWGRFFSPIYNFCTLLCISVFIIIQESEDQLKEHLIQQQNFLRDRGKKFFRMLSLIEKKIISTGIPQLTSKEMSANHKILSLYLSDYFYLKY